MKFSKTDIAGVDPVFIENFCSFGKFGEEFVAVKMEVADEREMLEAGTVENFANLWNGGGGSRRVYRDAD